LTVGAIVLTTWPALLTTPQPMVGFHTVPPFSIAEYATANCSGDTVVSPWPIAMSALSPAR
jgi:hypothetical protein